MEMDNQSYYRVIFASPSAERETRWVEIQINAPRLCPVCGSKDVSKLIRLGATNLGFFSANVANWFCIKIWVCKAHENLKTPRVRKLRGASLIYEYFRDQSVIHTAREDWMAEFRANNAVDSVVAGCRPFDVNSVALTKMVPKLFYGWLLSLFMMFVFNLIVPHFVGQSSWAADLFIVCMVIMIAFIFAFMIGMMYLDAFKLPALREMDYFGRKLRISWKDYLRDPMVDLYR